MAPLLTIIEICKNLNLGGGFKYFLFLPLFGEDFQFDEHIFQMGGSTINQEHMWSNAILLATEFYMSLKVL